MGGDSALRTVYLGQFEHETAERIAALLEEADIAWTYKKFGGLVKLLFAGDWGVRLYVDAARVDEARRLVEGLAPPPTD